MRKRLLVWLLAGTLGCAGGLVSVAGQRLLDPDDPVAVTAREEPSITPAPPGVSEPEPVSPADYQRVLSVMDARLRQDTPRLTSGQMSAALMKFVSALWSQADALEATDPPPAVASTHKQLLSALRTAAAELENVSVDNSYCGGPPATIRRIHEILTRRTTGLTHATAALRAARLNAGTFLPRAPDVKPRRGVNGKIYRSGKRGSGRLEITNNSRRDYLISVVTGKPSQPQIMIYVRARSKAKVSGVRGKVYHVYVKSGVDWDATRRQFTRDCTFAKFDKPFTQLSWPYYSIWRLTLGAKNGNATSSRVAPY